MPYYFFFVFSFFTVFTCQFFFGFFKMKCTAVHRAIITYINLHVFKPRRRLKIVNFVKERLMALYYIRYLFNY